MRVLFLLGFLCLPTLAIAQPAPKTIADCEKIKGDLAYNQCLANFGPKVGERRSRGGYAPADDEETEAAPARRGRSRYVGRGGRQRAVFEVGGRSRLRVSPAWRRAARSSR